MGAFTLQWKNWIAAAGTISPISIKHLLSCPLQKSRLTPAKGLGRGKKGEEWGWLSTVWNSPECLPSILSFPNALFTFRFIALSPGKKSASLLSAQVLRVAGAKTVLDLPESHWSSPCNGHRGGSWWRQLVVFQFLKFPATRKMELHLLK